MARDVPPEGCVFCQLRDDPDWVIAESRRWRARRDGHPLTPGHTLLTPARHVVSIFDLTAVEWADAFGLLHRTRAILDESYSPVAYNLGVNDGEAAGRTVHHLHLHLIPRYVGDVPDPRGGIRLMMPGPSPDLWAPRMVS